MRLRESCGVFGAYSPGKDIFPYLYWGMIAQNHRGHQSYGFATLEHETINSYTDLGLIPTTLEAVNDDIRRLKGSSGDKVIFRKVNILTELDRGKKIALIDDSIVRGDTTKSTIKRLRAAGAEEIHLFITYPKIIGPCFYGINMATFKELIGGSPNHR